jgi:Family of unknown function (DUF6441)
LKFVFSADEALLKELLDAAEEEIAKAKEGAVRDAAAEAVKEGRANIASAGFSARWRQGLRSKFYPNKGGDPAAIVFHRIGFASVFERGATIGGKNYMWLPVTKNLPGGIRSPRKYGKKLVSVNVAGKPPMLFDAQDRKRGPLFFGVRTVTIRKRWDLTSIFEDIKKRLAEFFEARMAKK